MRLPRPLSFIAMLLSLCLPAFGTEPVDAAEIVIDKVNLKLYLTDGDGVVMKEYGIACAKNYGNKQKSGDHKTPEGLFRINQLLDSRHIPHDFGDGKGPIAGAYGPWFLRLDVPGFRDIGIHGTHLPESIGSRATEGCIRLKNEDILDLKQHVQVGTQVLILPDSNGTNPFVDQDAKIYDIAFFSSGGDSEIDSMMQSAIDAGKKVCLLSGKVSDIQESIDSMFASRCVFFEKETEGKSLASRQILADYAERDSSITCICLQQ